jgi:hypothetical protein
VRNIAEVTTAVARETSPQIAVDVKAEILELKNTINTMVDQLNAFASEVTRVARDVGTEESWAVRPGFRAWPGPGRTSPTTSTSWARTSPPRCGTSPGGHGAVAGGDLSKKITVDVAASCWCSRRR